jgi:hypothetical protein
MCDPLRNDPDGVYRRGELPETGCLLRAKIRLAMAAADCCKYYFGQTGRFK